jgi:hypothetical protein
MRWLAGIAHWPVVWRRGVGWRLNRAGYASALRLLVLAERARVPVSIVPVGISYRRCVDGRRSVWLRYGRPLATGARGRTERADLLAAVEAEVPRLSELEPPERPSSRGTASTAAAASGPR